MCFVGVVVVVVVVLLFCFDSSGSFSKRALVTDLRADRCRRFLARGRLCRRRCCRRGSIVLRVPFGRGVRPALDAARIGRSVHLCLAIKSTLGHLVLQSFGFAQKTTRLLPRYLTCRVSVCLKCRLRRTITSQWQIRQSDHQIALTKPETGSISVMSKYRLSFEIE
jgi:hypothetical protein